MKSSDFSFELPPDLIAQHPAATRGASRLLHLPAETGPVDRQIGDLPALLRSGDLLVFNDTRVIKARLFGHKETGGRVQILVERVLDAHHALVQLGVSKTPRPGSLIVLDNEAARLRVLGREEDFFRLQLEADEPWLDLLERVGRLPLPPYICHDPNAEDTERYQTVFAREPGAVAAPTAGLHFDEALLVRLRERGIQTGMLTLHVGAGTFQPVRVADLSGHRMHAERYRITAALVARIAQTRASGGRVVAVGTTSVRALESAADAQGQVQAGEGETRIFITPGFSFRVADLLFTNFHLPESTLMMLVGAFGGRERVLAAYRHAVMSRYRFFSYGDAMLIEPESAGLQS